MRSNVLGSVCCCTSECVEMCATIEDGSCRINITDGLLLYYHQYSYYSQKVLMVLYEKNIKFQSQIIDLSKSDQYEPWFLQLNPKGEVPVLQDMGKILCDSSKIIDYLEDNFIEDNIPKLIPMDGDPEIRQKVTYFRHIIDQIPAGVITIGSFYHPELVHRPKVPFLPPVRKLLLNSEKTSAEKLKKHAEINPATGDSLLQKLKMQEKKHQVVTDKMEFLNILKQVEEVLDQIEQELSLHGAEEKVWWLCSPNFSVADVGLTVLLERLNQLGFENRFWKGGKRPNLETYYTRVQNRISYKKSIPNVFVHMKMFIKAQKPVTIGIAVTSLALLIGGCFILKKALS